MLLPDEAGDFPNSCGGECGGLPNATSPATSAEVDECGVRCVRQGDDCVAARAFRLDALESRRSKLSGMPSPKGGSEWCSGSICS